ncbi:MAG TPA: thioredoxin family protein [Phototrophicaceae bacterium]|jgi:thioredoxin 1|nr:thioredoxin family protein [Phototrophicaceae bacterium]
MIERLVFVIIAFSVGVVVYSLITRRQLALVELTAPRDPLLRDVPAGVPTIVYFTTPTCVPCQLQQTPTLKRLKEETGEHLQVIRVDATEDPDAASRWGVFSVPTTFVLDADGKPRSVFNGVVSAEVLRKEIGLNQVG